MRSRRCAAQLYPRWRARASPPPTRIGRRRGARGSPPRPRSRASAVAVAPAGDLLGAGGRQPGRPPAARRAPAAARAPPGRRRASPPAPDADLLYTDEDRLDAQRPPPRAAVQARLGAARPAARPRRARRPRRGAPRGAAAARRRHRRPGGPRTTAPCASPRRSRPARIRHIPAVLVHRQRARRRRPGRRRRPSRATWRGAGAAGARLAAQPAVCPARCGCAGRCRSPPRWSASSCPTRDRAALAGTLRRGRAAPHRLPRTLGKLLIADNGSRQAGDARAVRATGGRTRACACRRRPGPFNYAALNDDAAVRRRARRGAAAARTTTWT